MHDFRCIYLHVVSSSLTLLICHVLVRCFGSFLLQDMFLSLQVFEHDIYCERVACLHISIL